ncbi:hypothetical protein C8F01DRAFT_1253888 [Mycena amicta]|nr:hypothetical protein C8F01DRAFT_1253888 [Mycena amicta]
MLVRSSRLLSYRSTPSAKRSLTEFRVLRRSSTSSSTTSSLAAGASRLPPARTTASLTLHTIDLSWTTFALAAALLELGFERPDGPYLLSMLQLATHETIRRLYTALASRTESEEPPTDDSVDDYIVDSRTLRLLLRVCFPNLKSVVLPVTSSAGFAHVDDQTIFDLTSSWPKLKALQPVLRHAYRAFAGAILHRCSTCRLRQKLSIARGTCSVSGQVLPRREHRRAKGVDAHRLPLFHDRATEFSGSTQGRFISKI